MMFFTCVIYFEFIQLTCQGDFKNFIIHSQAEIIVDDFIQKILYVPTLEKSQLDIIFF